jgi:hypothetical protein
VLFIDARKFGRMVDRTHRELTDEDIARIANIYHAWRGEPLGTSLGTPGSSPAPEATLERGAPRYCDIPGFCKSATQEEIRKHGHVLTPGRYVDAEAQEDEGGGRLAKKMAGYHQFHAVQVAVSETLRAAELQREAERVAEAAGIYETGRRPGGKPGDRRVGVVWHTQGSGKSLTMAFYAGRIIREPAMENPTIVVLTDRNDLDDQLFGTFSRCRDLLRQPPVQAESQAHLRELLRVAAGVVFTTIHKFFPENKDDRHPTLSERRNIVVIADEAHRSQYDFIDGFARHMRDALSHASFIGFTGTPIELADANTRRVWRLHQRLRHPARRAGRRHRTHLLRKPPRQAGARRSRTAEDRPGLRGRHRGRGGRAQGEAQEQVGAA